jgi:hypothetical protein
LLTCVGESSTRAVYEAQIDGFSAGDFAIVLIFDVLLVDY